MLSGSSGLTVTVTGANCTAGGGWLSPFGTAGSLSFSIVLGK
ncbi:Uncharacterised protein [Mycobacteroides abscessus subsp. abscessus]|nr:Uncharacterised protein [Mycobacteroides abscessus subsp. abscessus]